MSLITYIPEDESSLINEELVPQFLGLWVKMYKEGVRADLGKRAMAVALFKTCPHLNETKHLSENKIFLDLCKDIGVVINKYCEKGLHYSQISASLEYQITNIIGTRCEAKNND